jgi:uncharacterized membrane protein
MILGFIGTVGLIVLAAVGAAIGAYFFLRNNSKKKAAIDNAVDSIKKKL